MREPADNEYSKRQEVMEFIKTKARMATSVPYLPPALVVAMLAEIGITVSKPYVYRRYEEMGIVNVNGIWIKKEDE